MKKKDIPKKSNTMEQSFSSSEVMSLLENMSDGISIIAEAQQETNQKLDRLEVKVDGIDQRLVNVENRLVNVEIRLVNVEDRLVNVENRLISVEDDVIEIKHRLSEKVDRDEFNKMEKRMIKLEKLVFAKLG